MIEIRIKKLREDAIIPYRGSDAAAAYDLAIPSETPEFVINPGETIKIEMGFATELPRSWHVRIFPRSGLAIKRGLRLANSTAIIDEDYRGEYIVALHNDGDVPQHLKGGERIAQMVIEPSYEIWFNEVAELSETVRGTGGLGSTGTTNTIKILQTTPPEYPTPVFASDFHMEETPPPPPEVMEAKD